MNSHKHARLTFQGRKTLIEHIGRKGLKAAAADAGISERTARKCQQVFERINAHLSRKGQSLRASTIMDATIIAATSSTKNADGERDPEMHQAKKGNQWHFGMKAHIGVDEDSGLVHHVECTAANVADVTQVHRLLHGQEDTVRGDSGYTGANKREKLHAVKAGFLIAEKPSKLRAIRNWRERRYAERWECHKASLRAKGSIRSG